jgi:hypothetical protein
MKYPAIEIILNQFNPTAENEPSATPSKQVSISRTASAGNKRSARLM